MAVREKRPLSALPRVTAAIAAVEKALGREGRVLVRASGTENKLRVLVEGQDQQQVQAHADADRRRDQARPRLRG